MKRLVLFLVLVAVLTARAETPNHENPLIAGEAFATPVAPVSQDATLFRGMSVDQDEAMPFESYIAPNEYHNYLMEACLPKEGGALISVGTFRALNVFSSGKLSHLIMLDVAAPTVAFNKVNLQLIAKAEDRWQYLSLLLTGEGNPFLENRARKGEITFSEFVTKLYSPVRRDLVTSWEKNLEIPFTDEMRTSLDSVVRRYFCADLISSFPMYEAGGTLEKSFLGNDERFNTLKRLISEDKVTVVTGNLAGEKTMSSLNRLFREKDVKVAAVDVSNVPDYLEPEQAKAALANIRALPMREDGRIFYTGHRPPGQGFKTSPDWAYYTVPPSYSFSNHSTEPEKFETVQGDPEDYDIGFQPKEAPCGKDSP